MQHDEIGPCNRCGRGECDCGIDINAELARESMEIGIFLAAVRGGAPIETVIEGALVCGYDMGKLHAARNIRSSAA